MLADWSDPKQIGTGETASPGLIGASIRRGLKLGFPSMAAVTVCISCLSLSLTVGATLLSLLGAILADQGSTLTILVTPVKVVYWTFSVTASVTLATLGTTEFRPMRHLILGLTGPPAGLAGHFRMMRENFLPTFAYVLLQSLLVGVGLCCCIVPGLFVLIAMMPGLYLVAAADVELSKALAASPRLVLSNALVFAGILMALLVLLVAGIVYAAFVQPLFGIVLSVMVGWQSGPHLAQLAFELVTGVVGIAFAYPMLCFWSGLMSAIEAADRGVALPE